MQAAVVPRRSKLAQSVAITQSNSRPFSGCCSSPSPSRNASFFALGLQRERQPKLRADTVAIRPHVAHDADALALANGIDDPIDDFGRLPRRGRGWWGVDAHSWGVVRSNSARMSSTRLPRCTD